MKSDAVNTKHHQQASKQACMQRAHYGPQVTKQKATCWLCEDFRKPKALAQSSKRKDGSADAEAKPVPSYRNVSHFSGDRNPL